MGIKAQTIINKVKNSLDLSMIEVAKEISSGLQEEKWKKKKKNCPLSLRYKNEEYLAQMSHMYILLQFAKGTAIESIFWHGQLSFVSSLRIHNPNICFLAKIPRVKVFCSQVPDSNIVERYQNCCPCSRINLDSKREREREREREIIIKALVAYNIRRAFGVQSSAPRHP